MLRKPLYFLSAFALSSALLVASAAADDVDDLDTPSTTDEPIAEDPTPTPTEEPATESPSEAPASSDTTSHRPTPRSFGIGIGYVYPADIQVVNSASARFVLSDMMIIEPIFELSRSSDSVDVGGTDSSDSETNIGLGAEFRYGIYRRPRTTFSLVGTVGLGYEIDNPDGDDNNTNTLTFGLGWGLGLDYWIKKHWGISFTITNPLLTYGSATTEGVGGDTTVSTTFFGLVWDNTVARAMVHMYF